MAEPRIYCIIRDDFIIGREAVADELVRRAADMLTYSERKKAGELWPRSPSRGAFIADPSHSLALHATVRILWKAHVRPGMEARRG